jgi:hypothetical protein
MEKIKELQDEVNRLSNSQNDVDDAEPVVDNTPEKLSPAKEALKAKEQEQPTREPKRPEHELPPETQSDYGGRRDSRDQKTVAADLKPDRDVNESTEKEDDDFVSRAKRQT